MILSTIPHISFGLAFILISLSTGEIDAQVDLQADIGTPGSDARGSHAVPQGEVRGIVVNADTGEPVDRVSVFVVGTPIDVMVDSTGHFTISGLERGTHIIQAGAVGYRSARVDIRMHGPYGFVARLSLEPHGYHLLSDCGIFSGRGGTVAVVVRDVLTRRAPLTSVALLVRRDSLRYWDFDQAEEGDSAVILSTGDGPGPFAVDVAAPGYSPWYRDSVTVETTECGRPLSKPRQVWLLPRARGID